MTVRNLFLICLFGICSSSEESKNQQLIDRIEALERTQTELMHVVERLSKSDSCAKALSAKCNGIDLAHLNKRLEGNTLSLSTYTVTFLHIVNSKNYYEVLLLRITLLNEYCNDRNPNSEFDTSICIRMFLKTY